MRYEDSCVNEGFNNYADSHSTDEPEILKELYRETFIKMINPRMISGKQQSNFLRLLCRLKKPKRVLEIGTYSGYSAISMGLEMMENSKLYTIEVNEEYEDLIRKYIQKAHLEDTIKVIIGSALDVLPNLNEKWDMVFIDGNKEEYHHYFDLIIDNVNPEGLIIIDNVLWSGKVLNNEDVQNDTSTRTIDGFNKRMLADSRLFSLLLPIRDGILLLQKMP